MLRKNTVSVPSRYPYYNKKLVSRNDFVLFNKSTVRRPNTIDRFFADNKNETDISEPLNYDYKDTWWKTIRTSPKEETVNIYRTLLTKTGDKIKKSTTTKTTAVNVITEFNEVTYFKDVFDTIKEANIVRSLTEKPLYESFEKDINQWFAKEDEKKIRDFYTTTTTTPRNSVAKIADVFERTKTDPLMNLDPMMLLDVAAKNINESNVPSMDKIFIDMPLNNFTYTKDKVGDFKLLNDSLNKLAQYYNFTAHHYGTSDLDKLEIYREGKEPATNATVVEAKPPSEQTTILLARTETLTTLNATTKVQLTPATPPSTTQSPYDTSTDRPFIPPVAETTEKVPNMFDLNRLTIPPDLQGSPTAEKPSKFMQAAQTFMNFYKVGYFSAYLISLFETLVSKPDNIAHLFFQTATDEYERLNTEEPYFHTFGETITDSLKKLTMELKYLPLEYVKAKILVLRFIAESRREATSSEVNAIVDYIDTLFEENEGRTLIKSVEAIKNYPNVSGNIYDVLKNMSNAVFHPLVRLAGTSKKEFLINAIEKQLKNGTSIFPKEMYYGFRRFNNGTRFKIVGRDILLNDTKRPDLTDEDLQKDVTNKERFTVTPVTTTTIRITKSNPRFLSSKTTPTFLTTKYISNFLASRNKKTFYDMNMSVETTPMRFKIVSRTTAKKISDNENSGYDDNHIADESVSEPCKYGQDINFKYERARSKHNNHKKEIKHFKQKHPSIYKKIKKYKKKLHKKIHDRKLIKKHKHGGMKRKKHKKERAKKSKSHLAHIRNTKTNNNNGNIEFSTYEDELSESQIIITSSQQLDLLNKEFKDSLSGESVKNLKALKSIKKDFNKDHISDTTKTSLARDKDSFLWSSEKKNKDKWRNNRPIYNLGSSNVKVNDTGSTSLEDKRTTGATLKSTAYLRSSSEASSEGVDVWSGSNGDVSEFVVSTSSTPTTEEYKFSTFNSLRQAIAAKAKAKTVNRLSSATTKKRITSPKKAAVVRKKWETFIKNKLMNNNIASILNKFKYDTDSTINKNKTENARKWVKVDVLSDYSDDEESLKNNLLDAIRHGDVNFRARRHFDDKPKYKITKKFNRFSSYSSEEIVLKSNIYKVIGFKGGNKVPTKRKSRATSDLMVLRARTQKIVKLKPINEMSSYSDDEEILKERIKKTNVEYRKRLHY